MGFIDAMEKELVTGSENVASSENGALMYATSGKELIDLNFKLSSLRQKSVDEIQNMFAKAFYENKELAMRWLFYSRDCREGVGERKTFRACMIWLANNHKEVAKAVLPLIPLYARWDDMWCLLDTCLRDDVIELVRQQLCKDNENMRNNKPISLLGKWLPSCNCSSAHTKRYGRIICKGLRLTERNYRKGLSALRKYLDVVEVKTSSKQWSEIDYNTVPSKANLLYKEAFLRNDTERRELYLEALRSGDKSVKINASVLFPHDIVHKYMRDEYYSTTVKPYDETLEQLWSNLNDVVKGTDAKIMTVVDTSGSMSCEVDPNSSVTAYQVATALGIYFSERLSGEYKDKIITFSHRPKYIDLSNMNNLHDKIDKIAQYTEVADTNVERTFDLILDTAVKNNLPQEDLPDTVLILSDMEFNYAVEGSPNERLFETIERKFKEKGYAIPKIVFWNIDSRSGAIPVTQNQGFPCALVSGFSTNVVKMVLSNNLDPWNCLLDVLLDKRYNAVSEVIKPIL